MEIQGRRLPTQCHPTPCILRSVTTGQTVRTLRKQLGLTQWRLALESGVHEMTVSRIERDGPASYESLSRLRQVLGDSIELPEIRPPWNRD